MAARAPRKRSDPADDVINLRVSQADKALIDRAAARAGVTRTAFVLDSARAAAEAALLDQRLFLLDEATYRAFVERLDRPAALSPVLRKLLATPAPWEG